MTPEIKEQLNKPLNKAAIATRKNYSGKGELSYIETHHAIREANTIFGFDGWSRETVQVERVATQPYKSKYDDDMVAVSYMARVRITVGDVVREGCGYGDGQAKAHQAYTAHELALKEAESDATKRALMTFGDPFGLALYEKDHRKREGRIDSQPRQPAQKPKAASRDTFERLVKAVRDKQSEAELDKWLDLPKVKEARMSLPNDWKSNLTDEINEHRKGIIANAEMDRLARVEN
jgi:DNA repair and recombination protein RAD52